MSQIRQSTWWGKGISPKLPKLSWRSAKLIEHCLTLLEGLIYSAKAKTGHGAEVAL